VYEIFYPCNTSLTYYFLKGSVLPTKNHRIRFPVIVHPKQKVMKTIFLHFAYLLLLLLVSFHLPAQVIRGFNNIYSDNIRGGHVMFGNTAMAIYSSGSGSTGTVNTGRMNYFTVGSNSTTSIYTNDENNMQFLDIDGDASTARSTSANLILPGGTNSIRFARLYWGARINNSAITTNDANLRSIKVKAPGGSYVSYTAPVAQVDKYAISTTQTVYQSFIDVTSIVAAGMSGTYFVADMAGSTGNMGGGGGYYGGWSIVVVYENPALNWTSIRLYDGYLQVFDGGAVNTRTVALTGLNAPEGTLNANDAYLSVMTWEGDASLAASTGNPLGDYIKINGQIYSDAVNPAANMWNGTISNNGSHVTTRNPAYLNQFGIDIDQINVGGTYGITGGIKEASIEFGTEADQYFPSLFAFSIRMQPPQIQVNKTVADENGNNFVEKNEILTFTINGWDELTATGYAYNARVVDTLTAALEYVPNSMYRWNDTVSNWIPITDAEGDDCSHVGVFNDKTYLFFNVGSGACAATGGTLVQGQQFRVRFQAKALHAVQINNMVRMFAESQSGDEYNDDGFAVIGANQAPLAIRLLAFNGNYNGTTVQLEWKVAGEYNTGYYEIERSTNGFDFATAGVIEVNNTSIQSKTYRFAETVDGAPAVLYYRLKEVEQQGKLFYSSVLKLSNGNLPGKVTLNSANPFSNFIQVQAQLREQSRIDIRITDLSGTVVAVRTFAGMKGNNLVRMDELGHLPNGVYLVQVQTNEGNQTFRVVKQ
jgi:hypothetical protein